MDKSPDAFRTISEVAEVLDTPAHVLRFWESRFPQIRPVKRAGGRRYYRPADVALLLGIKHLLHEEGMTIRGVQKVLREQGVRHVSDLSGQVISEEGETAEEALEAALAANFGIMLVEDPVPQDQIETAQVVALEDALRARSGQGVAAPDPAPQPVSQPVSQPISVPAEVLPLFEAPTVLVPLPDSAPVFELERPEPEADPVAQEHAAATPPPPPSSSLIAEVESLVDSDEDSMVERVAPSQAPQDLPLLARLRALPPGSLTAPEVLALRDRLAALVRRLASPPPQAPL